MWFLKNVYTAVVCQERSDIVIGWSMSVPVSNSFSFSLSEANSSVCNSGSGLSH